MRYLQVSHFVITHIAALYTVSINFCISSNYKESVILGACLRIKYAHNNYCTLQEATGLKTGCQQI